MPTRARRVATLFVVLFAAGCARTPAGDPGAGGTRPVATLAALSTTRSPETSAPKEPESARTLRVLDLRGTAYERGVEHGTRLRAEIATLIGLWKEDLRKSTGADPDTVIKQFLAETNFTPAIRTWTPDLLDEVRGIADGAGQPYDTVFAFQLVDELWVFADRRAAGHCTSLGVGRTALRPAHVAQNLDLESFRDGFQIVLRVAAAGSAPEQLVFTSAGVIGMNGVNERSIAVALNTLMPLAASSDGLPVAFIVRGVLAQTDGAKAVEFITRVKHASGQNYVIGTGDTVRDFEASAGKVA